MVILFFCSLSPTVSHNVATTKKTAHPKGCAVFVSIGKGYFPSLNFL